jgi:hypothetical protein
MEIVPGFLTVIHSKRSSLGLARLGSNASLPWPTFVYDHLEVTCMCCRILPHFGVLHYRNRMASRDESRRRMQLSRDIKNQWEDLGSTGEQSHSGDLFAARQDGWLIPA